MVVPTASARASSTASRSAWGGSGKGATFTANIEALDRLHLKTRLISSHAEPEMKTSFLGHEVAFPIFCSSMSGVKISMGGAISELEFAQAVIDGVQGSRDHRFCR